MWSVVELPHYTEKSRALLSIPEVYRFYHDDDVTAVN